MKLSPRIWLPILAALLVTAGLAFFLWWQVSSSARELRAKLQKQDAVTPSMKATELLSADPIDSGDEMLLALRRGDMYALQGQWKKAQEEYQSAVDHDGGLSALRKLAQAQLQRRDIDGVRSTIRSMERAGARAEDILLLQVIVALRTNDQEKAVTLLNEAVESPQKHYGMALVDIVRGNHEGAKTELTSVISGWEPVLREYAKVLQGAYDEYALFPSSRDIHLKALLGRALAQVQECELALPLVADAIHQQEDYRDAWIVQGYCQLTSERYPEALTSLERAYALDPEKPEIQYFLGRTYSAQNDHRNALTFYNYALKNGFQPEKEVRKSIAVEAEVLGDTDQAMSQYRALTELSDSDPESFAALIILALQHQKNDEAYTAAQAAITKWPGNAALLELHGDVSLALNKKDEAKTMYQQALQADPARTSASEKIKKL
jgi:tetratricopeptide (TPR) repeat protein